MEGGCRRRGRRGPHGMSNTRLCSVCAASVTQWGCNQILIGRVRRPMRRLAVKRATIWRTGNAIGGGDLVQANGVRGAPWSWGAWRSAGLLQGETLRVRSPRP